MSILCEGVSIMMGINKFVFPIFILFLTIFFSSYGFVNNASSQNNDMSSRTVAQTTYSFTPLTSKNSIFPSENCTKIVYWINGRGIEITDAKDISNIMNILSSTKLSKYETKEEKAGGLYIDIYYIDDVKRLTMLSDYIVLDGVSYKTNDDLTKLLQPYMDNYFLSNGYEEYVE